MKATLFHALLKSFIDKDKERTRQIILQAIASEQSAGHLGSATTIKNLLGQLNGRNYQDKNLLDVNYKNEELIEVLKEKKLLGLVSLVPLDDVEPIFSSQVEEEFLTIEREFTNKNLLLQYGFKPKQRVLLYGPSGCGKTSGTKRIAKNLKLPLIKINLDELIDSHVGKTAKNLRIIFNAIEEIECILLFDECDSLMGNRTKSNEVGEMARIVNSLLMMFDECNHQGIIICATNLEESLDSAIWRRFDCSIYIPIPSKEQIKPIILQALHKMPVEITSWNKLDQLFYNYSAADITTVCQAIAKKAILSGKTSLNLEDFSSSLIKRNTAQNKINTVAVIKR